MKNRKNNDDTTDTFPKVGDDEAEVVNTSGQRSPSTERVARSRTIAPPRPGQHVSIRRQRVIDAQSGQKLDADLAKGLTAAAQRHLTIAETVDQSHPSARPMLRHIFGLNLPGRGRA